MIPDCPTGTATFLDISNPPFVMLNLISTCLNEQCMVIRVDLVKRLTLVPQALHALPLVALITVRSKFRPDLLINSPPSVSVLTET